MDRKRRRRSKLREAICDAGASDFAAEDEGRRRRFDSLHVRDYRRAQRRRAELPEFGAVPDGHARVRHHRRLDHAWLHLADVAYRRSGGLQRARRARLHTGDLRPDQPDHTSGGDSKVSGQCFRERADRVSALAGRKESRELRYQQHENRRDDGDEHSLAAPARFPSGATAYQGHSRLRFDRDFADDHAGRAGPSRSEDGQHRPRRAGRGSENRR